MILRAVCRRPAAGCVLLLTCVLSLMLSESAANIPDVLPEDPAKGISFPPISVGVIQGRTCDLTFVVRPAMQVFVNASIYIDKKSPFKKAKPVLIFKNKLIRGVNRFNFIPGIELGIIGACAGEERSIRFPASLGFPDGSQKYRIPPNTPLKAIVHVHGMFYVPDEDMEADKTYEDPDIKTITGGKGLKKMSFSKVKKVNSATQFDAVAKGKITVVFLYTTWCGPCRFAEAAMEEAASTLSRGLGGDASKPVVVLGVDATIPDSFVSSFYAKSFPSIVVQMLDGSRVQYHGPKTSKDIIQFVESETVNNDL